MSILINVTTASYDASIKIGRDDSNIYCLVLLKSLLLHAKIASTAKNFLLRRFGIKHLLLNFNISIAENRLLRN